RDIRPGATASSPKLLTASNGKLFFSADDGTSGRELWASDGTPAGTYLVKDIPPGPRSPNPTAPVSVGGALSLAASARVYGAARRGVGPADGPGAGPVMVPDLAPGGASSDPPSLVSSGSLLYFAANGNGGVGDPFQHEPWAMAIVADTDHDGVADASDCAPS